MKGSVATQDLLGEDCDQRGSIDRGGGGGGSWLLALLRRRLVALGGGLLLDAGAALLHNRRIRDLRTIQLGWISKRLGKRLGNSCGGTAHHPD